MYTSEMIESLKKNDEFLSKVTQNQLEELMSEFDEYDVELFSAFSNSLTMPHEYLEFDSNWYAQFKFFDEIEKKSVTPDIEKKKGPSKKVLFS